MAHFSIYIVLHRMMLANPTHSSQFIEWDKLGITTFSMLYVPRIFFFKLPKNQITTNFIYLTSSDLMTISQINY